MTSHCLAYNPAHLHITFKQFFNSPEEGRDGNDMRLELGNFPSSSVANGSLPLEQLLSALGGLVLGNITFEVMKNFTS